MSPSHNNPPDPNAQLAHELANLLDGSLRHLGIAIDTLSQGPTAAAGPPDKPDPDDLLARLQTTDRAMRLMADLIRSWMSAAPKPRELFDQRQTLTQAIEQVIDLHLMTAGQQGIRIEMDVDPSAEHVPAGPIFPVLTNAVLNSVQAITAAPRRDAADPPHVRIAARVEGHGVCLTVCDNGPGIDGSMFDDQGVLRVGRSTRRDGHGLGLTLSDQIMRSLHGTLELDKPPTGGARLTLRYPLAGLGVDPHPPAQPPRTTTPTLFE